MAQTHEKGVRTDSKQLESLIHQAIKKVNGRKESDLCHFLPSGSGGYMHHFTLRKMKTKSPDQLADLLQKYIVNSEKPHTVPPKQRAPRGSRKRREQLLFSKQDLDRMLNMARLAGDKEMIRKLTPRKDLRTAKRELINSIKENQINPDLWNGYVETLSIQNSLAFSGTPVGSPF